MRRKVGGRTIAITPSGSNQQSALRRTVIVHVDRSVVGITTSSVSGDKSNTHSKSLGCQVITSTLKEKSFLVLVKKKKERESEKEKEVSFNHTVIQKAWDSPKTSAATRSNTLIFEKKTGAIFCRKFFFSAFGRQCTAGLLRYMTKQSMKWLYIHKQKVLTMSSKQI